ncbi:hypothetical protein SCG7109_AL_00260 [Chlamydiales bacterium SCGC AG-110-M15]|nr:hypothetical protein SCG7109_AL_00260 [Chlamydiales bacterium SCGC AG-110-M15]
MTTVQRKRTSRSVGLLKKKRTVKKASTKRIVKKVAKKRPMKKAVKVTAKKKPIRKVLKKKPIKKVLKKKPIRKVLKKKPIKKVMKKKPVRKVLKKKPIKKVLKKKPIKKVMKKKPIRKAAKKVTKKKVAKPSYQKHLTAFRKTIANLKTCYKSIDKNFRLYGDFISKLNEPLGFIHCLDAKFQKQFSKCAARPSAKGKSPNFYGKPARTYLTKEMRKWPAKYRGWQAKSKRHMTNAKADIKKAQQFFKLATKQLAQMKKAAGKPSPMFFRFEGQLRIFGEMNKCYEKHCKGGFC